MHHYLSLSVYLSISMYVKNVHILIHSFNVKNFVYVLYFNCEEKDDRQILEKLFVMLRET